MADYHERYAFLVPVPSERQPDIFEFVRHYKNPDDDESPGSPIVRVERYDENNIILYDDGGEGIFEPVVALVAGILDRIDSNDLVAVETALTCSKPRVDGFGGAWYLIGRHGLVSGGGTSASLREAVAKDPEAAFKDERVRTEVSTLLLLVDEVIDYLHDGPPSPDGSFDAEKLRQARDKVLSVFRTP